MAGLLRPASGLFHRTGVLWIGREGPVHHGDAGYAGARGVTHEIVRRVAARYPQMRLPTRGLYGIFEPESGVLMARRAVAQVVEGCAA